MAEPLSFDAYLGWVNITDPNNIPADARVISADDLLRYEKLGVDTAAKFAEVDTTIGALDSDAVISGLIATPDSEVRYVITTMVDTEVEAGVAGFQAVIDAVPANVEAQVDPLVAAAIAADSSIVSATIAAVDAEVQGRDLAEMPTAADETLAFSVVDEDNRRTWIESGMDARPSDHSAALIIDKIGPALTAVVEAEIGLEDMDSATTGVAFGVVDEDGRRTDIEVGEDGHFTPRVLDFLREEMNVPEPASTTVIASGDSMTGGAGGTPYPTHLANISGWNVVNMGVGGETTTTIAGRMGGRPMLGTVANNTIPASGPVAITLTSDDKIHQPLPLRQQQSGVNPVQIAGIEGALTLDANVSPFNYTFTRATAGTATAVPLRAPVITRAMREYRTGINVMWWGTNDGTPDMTTVIGRQRALIDWQTDPSPRWLVLGLTIFDGTWDTNTAQFLREYGRRFINLREYFSSAQAWTDSGLTPTQTDLDNQAIGKMPPTLMLDTTHFNNEGNLLVAKLVHARIKEMGWL